MNPIFGNVRVMRFALMFMYPLHTFDSHPVSAEGSRAGKLVGVVEKHVTRRQRI